MRKELLMVKVLRLVDCETCLGAGNVPHETDAEDIIDCPDCTGTGCKKKPDWLSVQELKELIK